MPRVFLYLETVTVAFFSFFNTWVFTLKQMCFSAEMSPEMEKVN